MEKINKFELSSMDRLVLESGYHQGSSHSFRMRCRAVLLKGDGLSLEKAREQTEISLTPINPWIKHFVSEGLTGLQTRESRGQKPIMNCSDEAVVRTAIEQDRQSVDKAKAA